MQQQTAKRPESLLKNRAYLALVGSQLISNLGDWLHILALLTLFGLKWQATPWQITGATLCIMLPTLLGGPLAGMLADRVERKKLMILSDGVRVILVLGMVFVQDIWQMYGLLVAKGLFDVIFSPAKSGKIKEIVERDQLDQAVSYSAIIEQGSKIVGPALGGLLTAAFGIGACFLIDAGSFLLSGLLLILVPGRRNGGTRMANERSDGADQREGFWRELSAGMRTIAEIPVIAYGLLALALVLLVLQIADSQTVVLFREIPGIPEDLLGWCIALSGAGTLLAAGLVKLFRGFSPLAKMGAGGTVMGAVFAGAGLMAEYGPYGSAGHVLMACTFFAAGLGAGMTFIPFQIELQRRTPERLTGRVFGTVSSVTSAAALLGPVCGGYLVTTFGASPAFLISGSLMGLTGLALLMLKQSIMKRDLKQAENMCNEGGAAGGAAVES
ncbi:MFS transporter [Paenibacillus sp. CAA11]|uniref:MFS transporter n=1 Tax=Paenibacillus sp. CAA11 TaxID=1532905 RepID=UPI000D376733|nr:MFS transporter [Paenibacillus sp. CAA11]AWB43331.1 MFS transporter [Paenibacillus sp. CAA11]